MYRRRFEVASLAGGTSPPELEIQIDSPSTSIPPDDKQVSKKENAQKNNNTGTKVSIMREILNRRGPYFPMLNKIFLTSWVIAVITDPFFLYIPTLNEEKMCLRMDKKLEIVALVLRSITDISYLLHTVFLLLDGFMPMPRNLTEYKKANGFMKYASARAQNFKWSNILIDILSVIPVPQVVILVYFSKIRPGLSPMSTRKLFLYMVLLLQYAPRVFQIYLSCEAVKNNRDAFSKTLWVRGAFTFFLYIIASHILGAFWYFFSIEKETSCWQYACKNQIGCLPSVFNSCNDDNTPRNLTFVSDFCPVNPPNAAVFDFGIFLGAIQSGIVTSTDFPKKVTQCFWWGLRNLSSFGSNLEASSSTWETFFAALISMLGLLIFLYLIGNLQVYMQFSTQRSEERRHNRKDEIGKIVKARESDIDLWASTHKVCESDYHEVKKVIMEYIQDSLEKEKHLSFKKLQKKLHSYLVQVDPSKLENGQLLSQEENGNLAMEDLHTIYLKLETIISGGKRHLWNKTEVTAELWMLKNGISQDIVPIIKQYVQHRLQNYNDNIDVDLVILFSILPVELQRTIKYQLCIQTIQKVPELHNVDKEVYEEIIKHVKPLIYAENSYIIRSGEPIGCMLFIAQGVVWVFGNGSMTSIEKGGYYGEQLLKWQLSSASFAEVPISTKNVQCRTKVEALALNVVDLNNIISKYWWKFPIEVELLKRFAVTTVGMAWKRFRQRKVRKEPSLRWSTLNRKLKSVTAWKISHDAPTYNMSQSPL